MTSLSQVLTSPVRRALRSATERWPGFLFGGSDHVPQQSEAMAFTIRLGPSLLGWRPLLLGWRPLLSGVASVGPTSQAAAHGACSVASAAFLQYRPERQFEAQLQLSEELRNKLFFYRLVVTGDTTYDSLPSCQCRGPDLKAAKEVCCKIDLQDL